VGSVLFGLSETRLCPVVEAMAGQPVARFVVEVREPVEGNTGLCGDKLIPTFRYTTATGRTGEATAFVKRFSWEGKSEAAHYRHLAAYGVPTPRLYGAISCADGQEILFLERLPAISFDRRSEAEWRAMLSLLARLNACPVTLDYEPHLHLFEQGGKVDRWWATGFMNAAPVDEEIEASLRTCGVPEAELSPLSRAARLLFNRVAALPRGLLHQDFLPDNLGWRGDREEMVVFDLHKNTCGPRFADVGPYLGLPDWSDHAAFLSERGRRDAFTRHYLGEYARFSGQNVTPETFRQETTLLSWAHKVAILWWLSEQKQDTRIQEVIAFLRKSGGIAVPGEADASC
jgi:aminoglycoside phosphotransferase (APT) family kinase protein